MRVQLAQQAQEILGTSDLVIITERVDDVALLIGQMVSNYSASYIFIPREAALTAFLEKE